MARLPGKKIDTWSWSKDRQEISVPVRLVRSGGNNFAVIMPELDIDEADNDLDALQKRVFALLDEKVNMVWEPFLHIEVSGDTELLRAIDPASDTGNNDDDDDDDNGDKERSNQEYREINLKRRSVTLSLRVEVTSYLLTTAPGGEKLSRRQDEDRDRQHTDHDWPKTGIAKDDENYRWSRDTEMYVRALVPDTPATREALNLLSRDLQRLTDRLQELFVPERVDQTLALAASGVKLLAPASPMGEKS